MVTASEIRGQVLERAAIAGRTWHREPDRRVPWSASDHNEVLSVPDALDRITMLPEKRPHLSLAQGHQVSSSSR
jgi:hypothetical protein